MLPSRSNTPAERSPASRTVVENAVRTNVCACSSTTAIKRLHMICIWICDNAVLGLEIIALPQNSGRAPHEDERARSGASTGDHSRFAPKRFVQFRKVE